MLNNQLKTQTIEFLKMLEGNITFTVSLDNSENSQKVDNFIKEVCSLDSQHLSYTYQKLDIVPAFRIDKDGETSSGIIFAGVPMGHEYNSFILALLQVSGRKPNIDDSLIKAIQQIEKPLHFITYVSLTCHNCPDVVQALNSLSVLNKNISHTMIDGSMFKQRVEKLGIMAVPTVFKNGEEFLCGKSSIEDIVTKLDAKKTDQYEEFTKKNYDMAIIGGGPAGISSAIYAARKGIKVAIIVEEFGGQVNETLGIENIIGTKYIDGPAFGHALEDHLGEYEIDIIKGVKVTELTKESPFIMTLENGITITSKTVIIATGARWRNLNIPGEQELRTKGVSYCPHCDAPLFADKRVAVIGGGNSGIEAAIDLSHIAKEVTILEFSSTLKADEILQERARQQANISIITNAQTLAIDGTSHVEGLEYQDRQTKENHTIPLDGVFIQIGLVPNTSWLKKVVECNPNGEIIIDGTGATNVPGLFAAGDCTDSVYKQIIISMGSGATAALGAFNYLMRH